MRFSLSALVFAMLLFGCDEDGNEAPCLSISFEGTVQEHCTPTLLARDDVHEVRLDDRGFYRRVGPLTVKAVPLAPLLDFELRDDAVLEAHGADGFAAPLDPKRLMAPLPSGARAHLAIEAPDAPWPPLGEGRPSAGPFAIVWTGDSGGDVSSEEWPYQIVSLRIVEPIWERYPGLMPAEELPEDAEERQGLEVFVGNCMPCHRLGGAGEAEMGPDLNQPMSPTEYLTDEGLRRLIRNPRSVRHWPASQMPATSEAQVSDPQLDALISYLHHMAARRGATVR